MVDALEKCPDRPDLIQDLHALQQRYAVGILATALSVNGIEPLSPSIVIGISGPTDDLERDRLATIYGSPGVASSNQYLTRYSITLAAQVSAELPGDATTTDVTDAYIRKQAGDETVRTGLRCLAHAMDDRVITALPIREAEQILRRSPALMTAPSAIDTVLNECPLITNRQGYVRFAHDQLGRFLAAEHFVLAATDGVALAHILAQPTHHDLQETALQLETDPGRRYDAIRELAQWQVLAAAVYGKFGDEIAKLARADITGLLIEAAATAAEDVLNTDVEHGELLPLFQRKWTTKRNWTVAERALLAAAGSCFRNGLFHNEITALMDASDVAIRTAIDALRELGDPRPVSEVIGSTFPGFWPDQCIGSPVRAPHEKDAGQPTAASIVAASVRTPSGMQGPALVTASRVWQENPRCYGRLYLAALLSNPIYSRNDFPPEDAENLPELVATGLALGGYHLRLELLEAAQYAAPYVKDAARERMVEVLNSYTPPAGDWATNNLGIEALARYGAITPNNSPEDISGLIAEVLTDENDPQHRQLAKEIVGRIHEDEAILGPYATVIESLNDEDRSTLFAMSVLAEEQTIFGDGYTVTSLNTLHNSDYVMRKLADHNTSPDGIAAEALRRAAAAIPGQFGFFQTEILAHLHALRGLAKVSESLPAADSDKLTDPIAFTWRKVDELLFNLFRGEDASAGRQEEIWNHLIAEFPTEAAVVLKGIDSSEVISAPERTRHRFAPHAMLVTHYPDHIRKLLEWALAHRDQFPPMHRRGPFGVDSYSIRTLGLVGTAETADLLRQHYVLDPDLGVEAVKAKRAIDARLGL